MTSQQRLISILHSRGKPMTLTEIGAALWKTSLGRANRQAYARPAGAVVARAVASGLLRQSTGNRWTLTDAGRQTFSDPNQPDLLPAP